MHNIETNTFWSTYEEVTGEIIPQYLKNLITVSGYARYSALIKIDDRLIHSLETFAKEQLSMFFDASSENFHIYFKNPEKFKIVPGHVELLKEAAEKLPADYKAFAKLYRKNYAREAGRSKYSAPSTNNNGQHNFQVTSEPAQLSLESPSLIKDQPQKTGSQQDLEIDQIKRKIMRWIECKKIKLKHDPQVFVVGPRQGKVRCGSCTKMISISTRINKNGSCGWIISNFTQHLADHERPSTVTINKFFSRINTTQEASATFIESSEDHGEDHGMKQKLEQSGQQVIRLAADGDEKKEISFEVDSTENPEKPMKTQTLQSDDSDSLIEYDPQPYEGLDSSPEKHF